MINVLLIAVLAYIVFAVVIFPLVVMLAFAIGALWPYILGVAVFYIIWKLTSEKGDRGDRG